MRRTAGTRTAGAAPAGIGAGTTCVVALAGVARWVGRAGAEVSYGASSAAAIANVSSAVEWKAVSFVVEWKAVNFVGELSLNINLVPVNRHLAVDLLGKVLLILCALRNVLHDRSAGAD
jgi:hypothetical protein